MAAPAKHSCMDLIEAEDIKKRWQEYTEEPYKKAHHDPDNHEAVITNIHLEPDILECEVRWALGSITINKAGGGDGIPDGHQGNERKETWHRHGKIHQLNLFKNIEQFKEK